MLYLIVKSICDIEHLTRVTPTPDDNNNRSVTYFLNYDIFHCFQLASSFMCSQLLCVQIGVIHIEHYLITIIFLNAIVYEYNYWLVDGRLWLLLH